MKKFNKKQVFNVLKRLGISAIVVVLLVVLPAVKLGKDRNLELIYEKFIGSKSEYQGMIEIWNIDTFEGGNVSKISLLSKIAKEFQQENKGLYFMVRNVSESECENLLASGQVPDLFSCSYGVIDAIKDYVSAFECEFDIFDNLLKAGQDATGSQFGVAWCANSYFLISTKKAIESAGQTTEKSLLDICLECGYTKTTKKGEKTIYSLELGFGKYLLPQLALSSYYNNGEFLISKTSINKDMVTQTSYSAYCNFIAGKSSVLLGTVRDVYRVKNRETNGKLENVIVYPLQKFNDLVQFAFAVKGEDETKNKYIQKFVKFLTETKAQEIVAEGGMFAVKHCEKQGTMKDIIPENIKDYDVLNVFVSKNEIKKLQQDFLNL